MTIPTGSLKASTFRNEFGATSSNGRVSLGAYRVNQDVVNSINHIPGVIQVERFENNLSSYSS